MEHFGFTHYHLFCPMIKYFIVLKNIKTLKCIYECMQMITKHLYLYHFMYQYHMKSAISVFLLQKSA